MDDLRRISTMMTKNKCLEIVDFYQRHLQNTNARPVEVDYDDHYASTQAKRDHLLAMLPKMRAFINEGRREKFMRWLGFMQGAFWYSGEFSLNEARDHNRPDAEDVGLTMAHEMDPENARIDAPEGT